VAYNHVPLDSIQRRGFVNKEFASWSVYCIFSEKPVSRSW
jgi:hypothetical protein